MQKSYAHLFDKLMSIASSISKIIPANAHKFNKNKKADYFGKKCNYELSLSKIILANARGGGVTKKDDK